MTNDEIIAKITAWQSAGFVHELTCGNDSTHAALVPVEDGGVVVLVCPTCKYVQTHIPPVCLTDHVERQRAALRALKIIAGPCIKVWRFHEAPEEFKTLSGHGGDEDWVALIPKELAGDYYPWMESGSPFGCCDVSEHVLDNGDVVRIGAHS